MRVYLYAAAVLVLAALTTWAFFFGRHTMVAQCQADTAALKLGYSNALVASLRQQLKDKEAYDAQLKSADTERKSILIQLDHLNAGPHPDVLCHAKAPGGSGGLPKVPGDSSPGAAGAGTLPQPTDFDPTERLYAEVADASDYAIEQCRDFINRVPHSQ